MAQGRTTPSRKVQLIWAMGFLIFATWLFYDRAEIYFNSDKQDAVVVGCASKGAKTRQSSATSSKSITVYAPIALSEADQRLVGDFWLRDKVFCTYQQGRAVQVFVHKTDPERNSINSFLNFWLYAYCVAGLLIVFFLMRISNKAALLFSLLAFAFAAYMVDREIGLVHSLQKNEAQAELQDEQGAEEDLSALILNQCISESLEKYGLSAPKDVTTIICSGTAIRDLSSLSHLDSLRELYVPGSQFASLETLPSLPKLEILKISNNKNLTSLKGIENAPNLEELQAYKSAIKDLSGLEALQSLRVLALYNNDLEDVSAVAGLSKLEDVIVSSNRILNIEAFANKPMLKKFQIYHNQVRDAMPLAGNRSLEVVGLRGDGKVPCQQINALRAALPHAKIFGQKACD